MDRSSHVLYRKRQGTLEITVSRGVIASEIDLLFSKLAMHRSSVPMSSIIIIKGTKKFRLGSLDDLDFDKLKDMIGGCLKKYSKCGLLIIDAKPGSGAMHKAYVHKPRFKSNVRRKSRK